MCCYLYKEDNEEVEVCYPSELLKQILGDKIPNGVLKEKDRAMDQECSLLPSKSGGAAFQIYG